jgi:predicted Rossmann fold nucleotide-binding protein DprA/Smf involved in DNA uptake
MRRLIAGLSEAGVTYAVFGSGLDFVYPRENRKLAENAEEKGALVSEFRSAHRRRRRTSRFETASSRACR